MTSTSGAPLRDGLRLAVGTLSRLPTAPPGRVDRSVARVAMLLAPVAVVPPALLWAAAHLAVVHTSTPGTLVGVLLVAATALWSRGLHLDGLADTCDGLSASYDRDRALAVMKTGDVGPSGAVALGVVLLAQSVALGDLLSTWGGTTLALVALLASRHALAWGCARAVPAARPGGLGAAVGGSVGPAALAAATVVVLALSTLTAVSSETRWYAGPLVVGVGLLGAVCVLRTAVRRLGGMSGDVLGAVVEVTLTAGLVAATLVR